MSVNIAVDLGRKARKQTNKTNDFLINYPRKNFDKHIMFDIG